MLYGLPAFPQENSHQVTVITGTDHILVQHFINHFLNHSRQIAGIHVKDNSTWGNVTQVLKFDFIQI